jgi:choline dehydrogenase-like flavoprotein
VTITDEQRRTLSALVDTFVAAAEPPPGVGDPDGFYARTGSQVGADGAVEFVLAMVDPALAAGLIGLIDALAGLGFAAADPAAREGILSAVAESSPEAGLGVLTLRAVVLSLSYTVIDESGTNPFWSTIGYPAPSSGPGLPHAIQPEKAPADGRLEADIVVIGSGAGGGVIAAQLAAAGRSVVVVEGGGYFDGETALQHEVYAAPTVFYRGGGLTATADGNVNLWAGATLGGGTTVNWSNCVRPPAALRSAWARDHGLTGVDGPEFDEHLDAVLERIGANEAVSVYNGPHRRMLAGADKLGWSNRRAMLNLDGALIESDRGALLTYGDRTGAKQSTLRTFLVDATAHGARVFVRTVASKVLVQDGRAVGVAATHVADDGTTTDLEIRAGTVVVAAGALETPALLLRSGIGGPAAGQHLHLHPSILVTGVYDEPQTPWAGPIQSAIVDEFATASAETSSILIESVASQVGATAATLPWTGAADHKRRMARMGHMVSLVAIVGDQGAGSVTIDGDGSAVHLYPVQHPADRAAWYRGLDALARIHEAAGAKEMWPLTPTAPSPTWHAGEDLDAVVAAWRELPLGFGGHYLGSAHQMGSARMGTDPATSVAGPTGELHDVSGVWIGDTSAFPTALGVNPMVTCMALARRTARAMLS